MRVLTWNLWWQFGPWEARQAPILANLRALDADAIGLQEIWPDQAARLADELGMFHATSGRFTGDGERPGFGNAILSRWPITETADATLPAASGPGYRTVLHAQLDAPFGPVPFFTTHLAYRYDESALRQRQLQAVSEFVVERIDDDDPFPPVLVGDLNAVADSDEVRTMTGRSAPYVDGLIWTDAWEQRGEGPGITWSEDNPYVEISAWPNRRIDYVLIGWPRARPAGNPSRCELFGTETRDGVLASDHYGVYADLELPPTD